jgi:hypothetical protein
LARGPDGSLSIWFTTIGIAPTSDGGFIANGPVIGRAVAKDAPAPAFAIAPDNAVVAVGPAATWDRYFETATMHYDAAASRWRAWYLGYSAKKGEFVVPDGGVPFKDPAIGQAVSTDATGTAWARGPQPIYRAAPGAWDGTLVLGPSVTQGPDGVWRLYYTGVGQSNGIGLLTSSDGVTWTPYSENPVFVRDLSSWDQGILEACVVFAQGHYWMWYSAYKGTLDEDTTRISIGLRPRVTGCTGRATRRAQCSNPAAPARGTISRSSPRT